MANVTGPWYKETSHITSADSRSCDVCVTAGFSDAWKPFGRRALPAARPLLNLAFASCGQWAPTKHDKPMPIGVTTAYYAYNCPRLPLKARNRSTRHRSDSPHKAQVSASWKRPATLGMSRFPRPDVKVVRDRTPFSKDDGSRSTRGLVPRCYPRAQLWTRCGDEARPGGRDDVSRDVGLEKAALRGTCV